MKVLGISKLNQYAKKYSDVGSRLGAWVFEVKAAKWNAKEEIKKFYPNVMFLPSNLVEFGIRTENNFYRLIVKIAYRTKVVKIEKLVTKTEHSESNIQN